MQTSTVIRLLALALFFLFPLVSVIQLRDTDAPWRKVAERVRPAVVMLHGSDGASQGCGLIIQDKPLRLVTVGVPRAGRVVSTVAGQTVTWSAILIDKSERFTVLQADGDRFAETEGAASVTTTGPGVVLDLESGEGIRDGVKAALVGPADFPGGDLWVGTLRAAEGAAGAPMYRTHLMRNVPRLAGPGTSDAWAEQEGAPLDDRLQGAPFVDVDGTVLGLYLDRDGHHAHVLPIAIVCQSLALLHLQAAQ